MSRTDLLPGAIINHSRICHELKERYASLVDDREALNDTAEGEGSTLPDLLKRVVWEIRRLDRDEAAINTRLNDLRERKNALQERQQRLRALVAHGMTEGGIPKLDDPEFSAGISDAPPKLVITDESAIPETYLRSKVVNTLDRVVIQFDLIQGHTIPGAHLSNGGQTLTIRPKRARKEAAE